jgi:hypothetical protein
MRRPSSLGVAAPMALASAGCWSWQNQGVNPRGPQRDSSAFQVWSGDSAYIVQVLRVERDTLYGIRAEFGLTEHSAIAIPMAEVDSIRSVRDYTGPVFLAGLAGTMALLWWLMGRFLAGS